MMKLANILKPRGTVSGQFLNWNISAQDVFGLQSVMGCAAFSTVGEKTVNNDRIFAAYSVYKGKAALTAEPVPPTFNKVNSGALCIKRSGVILMSFSPAVGERKYDWERKQKFALSPTEVGSLINLGPTSSCEFFHDPAMKSSNAGQVRKTLAIRANEQGSGYFITLTVNDTIKKLNERFIVPVTSAEFAVLRTSFTYALPHIIGWDQYTQVPASKTEFKPEIKPELKQESFSKGGRQRFDAEWDK